MSVDHQVEVMATEKTAARESGHSMKNRMANARAHIKRIDTHLRQIDRYLKKTDADIEKAKDHYRRADTHLYKASIMINKLKSGLSKGLRKTEQQYESAESRLREVLKLIIRLEKDLIRKSELKCPINPFVRPWNSSKKVRDQWEEADYGIELKNAKGAIKWNNQDIDRLSGYIGSRGRFPFQRDANGFRKDKEAMRKLGILVFRHGQCSEAAIEAALQHFYDCNGRACSSLRTKMTWAKKYVTDAQKLTLSYMEQACGTLVERSGGIAAWKSAPVSERERLILEKFNEIGLIAAARAFPREYLSVDFQDIFGLAGRGLPEFDKWKEVTKLKFVGLALKTIECRTLQANATPKIRRGFEDQLQDHYKNHMLLGEIAEIDLGDESKVPARDERLTKDPLKEYVDVDIDII